MPQLTNNKIKFIRSLNNKKQREIHSLFLVEGEKLVREAINSSFEVIEVYKKEEVGEQVMERISSTASPSPILAVVSQKNNSISELHKNKDNRFYQPSNNHIIIALDGIKDPGNLGTIIRTAEWFGVCAVIVSNDSVELYNPKCVQSTMGAIFRMPVFYVDSLEKELRLLSDNEWEIYGTFLDGTPNNILNTNALSPEIKEAKNRVVVFGNESSGISNSVESVILSQNRILIPPYSHSGDIQDLGEFKRSESLNVASSVASVLALLRR